MWGSEFYFNDDDEIEFAKQIISRRGPDRVVPVAEEAVHLVVTPSVWSDATCGRTVAHTERERQMANAASQGRTDRRTTRLCEARSEGEFKERGKRPVTCRDDQL
jgi:hypothetical protein